MKRALAGCIALLAILSCSKAGSPTEPIARGTLIVTVHDATSNTGLANVTVEIRKEEGGSVFTTAATDASGVCKISVPAGTWFVRVVPPSGYAYVPGGGLDVPSARMPIDAGATTRMTVGLYKS